MLEKLVVLEKRFEELTQLLVTQEIISNRETYREYSREHSDLEPVIQCYREWKKVNEDLKESKEIIEGSGDADLKELALAELESLRAKELALNQKLMLLLIPKDPNDEKNIILEIRAGTGGDEAALFVGNLLNMYMRYAETKRWRVELLSTSESTVGGYKEVIARIEGRGVYSQLKYERGVHRVQRVPKTETQGRIHTSTVTVAVLPEAEAVEVQILDKDLRIDVFRSSGPGGQSVNTTDSAVRVTHLPTGIVVSCQDEKSQLKNKSKALTVLRARLFDMKQSAADAERSEDRRSQIGTGERSERIRTYNFPQGRVTDHRIGLSLYQIDAIMAGEIQPLIDPLIMHYRTEALKEIE